MTNKLLLAAALAAVSSAPVLADGLSLETHILKTEAVRHSGGATSEKQVAARKAVPGDPMIYVLSYRNAGATAVSDVVLESPVPGSMIYRGAGLGIEPEVSIDGVHFGPLAGLSVTGPGGVSRPARLSDVVHVRWRIAGSIPPGAAGEVSFHAALR